ncbi:MAG: cupin domain-containing protein [Anaerolineales bacterium]
MPDQTSFYVDDLSVLIGEIPDDTIVSRTYYEDDRVKAILFGFAPGQELSEHTASQPAILHFLDGEADLLLGTEQQIAGPGTWVHMPARLPHSILAKTRTLMLLILFQQRD